MALTDFFGNIFTKKILGKGLDAAFGGDGNGGVPQIQYNIPSYGQYEMPISEQVINVITSQCSAKEAAQNLVSREKR